MLTIQSTQILALLLAAVWCISYVQCAVPDVDPDYTSLQYRDETASAAGDDSDSDMEKKEDGLGSLLLKNLRFRDVSRYTRHMQPLQWLLKSHRPSSSSHNNVYGNGLRSEQEYSKALFKRADVSVSQLAKLLNTLKTRNADANGVKLQSLRFGK